MTSLVQAKTINSSGVYVVGHVDTKRCSPTEQGRRLSFNDVIRLTVPTKDESAEEKSKTKDESAEEKSKTKVESAEEKSKTKDESAEEKSKTYSVDELKDLQSKLMLIAGKAEKGKDEVEQFVKASLNLLSKWDRKMERMFKFKVGDYFCAIIARYVQ